MTALQVLVLAALVEANIPQTPNEIGAYCEAHGWTPPRHPAHDGRRMGLGSMLRSPISSLERQGLVMFTARPDGLTGSAYELTSKGVVAYAWRDIKP